MIDTVNSQAEMRPYDGLSIHGVSRVEDLTVEPDYTMSMQVYDAYRGDSDGAIKMGLYGDDLATALEEDDTSVIIAENKEGNLLAMPLFVPAEKLEWYNMDFLCQTYGDAEILYYAHPPVDALPTARQLVIEEVKRKIDDGAIVFFDEYRDEDSPGDWLGEALSAGDDGSEYTIDTMGGGEVQRKVDIFVGSVSVLGDEGTVRTAPSFVDVYNAGVESGLYETDVMDGVSIVDKIDGDEAERIWDIYENPFNELGEETPTLAGFDKHGLTEILNNPRIAKVINRVDGKISTLCFFLSDFSDAPWFNDEYYKKNYPEYYETENILMFPGIVSDENMRGNDYGQAVIDLVCSVAAKRGSDFLVTFECTEISTAYIPKIVQAAVTHNGLLGIKGLDQPVSIMEYKAIRREAA